MGGWINKQTKQIFKISGKWLRNQTQEASEIKTHTLKLNLFNNITAENL